MMVGCVPPRMGFAKLNTDGAFSQTTGKTSTGGILRDHYGNWIGGFHRNIVAIEFKSQSRNVGFEREIVNWFLPRMRILVDWKLKLTQLISDTKAEIHPLGNLLFDCGILEGGFYEAYRLIGL